MSDAMAIVRACRETTTTRQEGATATPVRTPDTAAPAPAGAFCITYLHPYVVACLFLPAARCWCPMLTQQRQLTTYCTFGIWRYSSHHSGLKANARFRKQVQRIGRRPQHRLRPGLGLQVWSGAVAQFVTERQFHALGCNRQV